MGASHLGSQGRWGSSPSDAGPLPPLLHQGMGCPRAEERGRRKPWSGSSSDPCRAGSTLSTPTTNTSHPALQGTWKGTGAQACLPQFQPSQWPWPLFLASLRAGTYVPGQGRSVQFSLPSEQVLGRAHRHGKESNSSALPLPPRAPLLSCLFPSPSPHAPLSLQGLRCPRQPLSRASRPYCLSYSGTPQLSRGLPAGHWPVCPTEE